MRQVANALTSLRVWNETEFIAQNEDDLMQGLQSHILDLGGNCMQEWMLNVAVDLLLLGRCLGQPLELAETLTFMASFYVILELSAARAEQRLLVFDERQKAKESDADSTHQTAE